ncbi:hypothetical protein ACSBR1_032844 [Camellia fascicularis]
MANDKQGEKIGDDIPSKSRKHADPNIEEENRDGGAQDLNLVQKDISKEGNAPKKPDRDKYYNESDL